MANASRCINNVCLRLNYYNILFIYFGRYSVAARRKWNTLYIYMYNDCVWWTVARYTVHIISYLNISYYYRIHSANIRECSHVNNFINFILIIPILYINHNFILIHIIPVDFLKTLFRVIQVLTVDSYKLNKNQPNR